MRRRSRAVAALVCAVCVALAVCLLQRTRGVGREVRLEPARVEWVTMGTVAAVQMRGEVNPRVAEVVRETFSRVERLMNAHDPASELCRLAHLPDDEVLERCDPSMRECYEAAFALARATGGAFSPRWRGQGTMDLGAIAKGFAADLAERALREAGLDTQDILIDLGGNLKSVCGDWATGVYRPGGDVGHGAERFSLAAGAACATSGEYARGKHIGDGRTGRTIGARPLSVTVVHPTSAMLADGLSTVMFILGEQAGARFLAERFPEARAIWLVR